MVLENLIPTVGKFNAYSPEFRLYNISINIMVTLQEYASLATS